MRGPSRLAGLHDSAKTSSDNANKGPDGPKATASRFAVSADSVRAVRCNTQSAADARKLASDRANVHADVSKMQICRVKVVSDIARQDSGKAEMPADSAAMQTRISGIFPRCVAGARPSFLHNEKAAEDCRRCPKRCRAK